MSNDALVIRLQVLKVHFDCLKASNFRLEKIIRGGPFDLPAPLDVRGLITIIIN